MQHNVKYNEILKANKQRSTKQKETVFNLFLSNSKPLSTGCIIRKLPDVDKSTIYRILENFIKINIIKTIPRGFKTLYEISDIFHPHHHHITCESCNKTHSIASDRLEKLIHELSRDAEMKPMHHHIELFGICKDCQKN